MENNKQLGPQYQMQHPPPVHYNDGSEAAAQLSLNWLFQSLNSGQITWQQKGLHLSVGVLHGVSSSPELSQETWWMWFKPPWKTSATAKNASVMWSGETLCKLSMCALQMEGGLPKMCQAVGGYVMFLICAFRSMCEFSTCRAPSVLDSSFPSWRDTPLPSFCVWTPLPRRQRMTTSCLGLFISDWLYRVTNQQWYL